MPDDIAALEDLRDRIAQGLSQLEQQIAEAEQSLLTGDQEFSRRFADFYGDLQEKRAASHYDLGRLDAALEDRRARLQEQDTTERTGESAAWWRDQPAERPAGPPPSEAQRRDWWRGDRQETANDRESPVDEREPSRDR